MTTIKKKIIKCLHIIDDCIHYKDYKSIVCNAPYEWCSLKMPEEAPHNSHTHPSICYVPETIKGYNLWLATTPYPDSDNRYENPCIYYANQSPSSSIISTFKECINNPIHKWNGIKGSFNSDVELFFFSGKLYSIIRENRNGKYIRELKIQESVDGTNWTKAKHILGSTEEEKQLISPSILVKGSKFLIYTFNFSLKKNQGIEIYESNSIENPEFQLKQIGTFTNKDIVKIEPWHFDVFEYDNKIFMVLCAYSHNRKFINQMHTYLAISNDGINFHIYKKPLVKMRSYRPSCYLRNGYLFLYFSVVSSFVPGRDRNIGVARFKFEELLTYLQQNEA